MPILIFLLNVIWVSASFAHESQSCQTIRFSDTGWTETSASTALASEILKALGYETKIMQLSVPITYSSLKNQEVDLFLGNWFPIMSEGIKPYLEDHSIEMIGTLLRGAKSTLVVPEYVHARGVQSIDQLSRYSDQFHRKIFGIEAGSNGNKKIADLIRHNAYDLGKWELSESSEQGMLAEVQRAYHNQEWIVFLGWEPHPMNRKFKLHYLRGGDEVFGKDQGSATIQISTRKDYSKECPQVVAFFKNFVLDNSIENELMELILDQGLEPKVAAHRWLHLHWRKTRNWLIGQKSLNGERAFRVIQKVFSRIEGEQETVSGIVQLPKIPVGRWVQSGVLGLTSRFEPFFRLFSSTISAGLESIIDFFLWFPAYVLIGVFVFITAWNRRTRKESILLGLLLVFIWDQGYWVEAIETVILVIAATLISIGLGIPIGIYCAHHKKANLVMQPILDFMQTIPTFVYLIPTLMLFGLGLSPALVSTIIFVVPTSIRLTFHGIKSVPFELIETGEAFGVTPWQRIWLIEIPYSFPTLRVSVSQSMMLSLSMVVISALVGAEGLGKPVVQSLSTVNIAQGFEAGFIIVILSVLFNKILGVNRSAEDSSRKANS